MSLIYLPDTPGPIDGRLSAQIGGKCTALFELFNAGFAIPRLICVGTRGYELYVEANQLGERINLELHRKEINEMRWEEIWDISLRIQNLFLGGKFPEELYHAIKSTVHSHFGEKPLVVRSSAPGEDSETHSFAGLHESYVNVVGFNELLKKIKKVWASLWSDRAILYRQELGLDVTSSRMAVIVQEFTEGERSGVLFTRDPLDSSQLIIEAVYGLNQGLVDGTVDPDRWTLDRKEKTIRKHSAPPHRNFHFVRSPQGGILRQPVTRTRQSLPPLTKSQVQSLADIGQSLEIFFGAALDVEWTFQKDQLRLLQCRPITAVAGKTSTDKRSWYLSLNRSFDNLLQLWNKISNELLPEMDSESSDLAHRVVEDLSNSELADELQSRADINDRWVNIYWSEFIPFAHGVRLFGELYNDVIEPDDPFEFVSLLTKQNMLSTKRNEILYECAVMVRNDMSLRALLEDGKPDDITDLEFQQKLSQLRFDFSMSGPIVGDKETADLLISATILQYTRLDAFPGEGLPHDSRQLESLFLERAKSLLPVDPARLLDMARASYRIRDDDNIHIGRIAQELERSTGEARKRLQSQGYAVGTETSVTDIISMLQGKAVRGATKKKSAETRPASGKKRVQARQLLGQPASRGIARGRARVIASGAELKDFTKGEILVIDSIDPTMTFFAPLAAGIIERRGGMLIHGAIIAREYGIPCITGVVDATSYIRSGDMVTVDAFLGICTVQRQLKSAG